MTKIVVDTNIAFSAMLNSDSRIGQILISGGKHYEFFAPEYLKTEIIGHKGKIKQIAQLTDDAFIEVFGLILQNVTVLNHSIVPLNYYHKAEELCKFIDIDDTIFVAVTEFTEGKLWTGDLALLKGLIKQDYKRFIRTDELYYDFIKKAR